MKKTVRMCLLAGAALAALAFASSALASFAPKLVVSSASAGATAGPARLGVVVGATDDPTAEVQIYVPSAYTIGTPAAGTKLGNVTATAAAADLGNTVLPLTGELDAIAPNATTQADAQACGVTPAQTWDLHLSAAGQTLDIPMFVAATAAPIAALGYTNELIVCLPPPDVPAGTPGRAVFGAKLLSATFTSSALNEPSAAGDYRWTSLWTPYTPNTGKPNPAGTVEAQSIRHLPTGMILHVLKRKLIATKTVKVKVKGKKRNKKVKVTSTKVTYTATATENGKTPVEVAYATKVGGKTAGAKSGSFTLAHGKSTTIVTAAAIEGDTGSVPTGVTATLSDLFYHDLGSAGCVATPVFGGLPCTDATLGSSLFVAVAKIKGY